MGLGELVLARLKASKIRPAELARALEVDRSTASLMLSGKRGIPTWHLDAIAKMLNLEVPQLFTKSDLVGQAPDPELDPLRGSDVAQIVAAHARIQQRHQDLLAATEAVAMQLADTLVAQGIPIKIIRDDARAGKSQSGSRRRPRKVG